ncbi:U4 U6.U5 tri-snRNP-associated protein [Coemansia sp. RSA 1813]|nr:Ubiquitin carboxyl-terminal hydrolase 10 [Coemansia sp. RSA 1646]KAJ1765895.1 U4 U6.U5 tri-snRNP-associated protein [Coemansia sp. RSA 1843]KAJ2087405.1 U4 U6.U5 tri-snRNP-associated protein [Coemansia sp. RSA 986]KAJ2212275.1 U4 U6.U5 tri-snRNP-associated protein [Coemansia sp. RSA 487]KAJ2566427.1 U4 U6.U5 tri-snRNP-associated protein [Coemansia sp. RSA 1813]
MTRKRATAESSALPSAQEKARKLDNGHGNPSAPSTDDEQPSSPATDEAAGADTRVAGMYLDTVDRSALDFDFEQVCSISLSKNNVYACLVCGRYYQGRGKQTHAYFHSINDDHHVFINLKTLRVYVLPDNYQVQDKSLNDIKAVISPDYTALQVNNIDMGCEYSRDLSGKKYMAGFVGLNKIKSNDYMNVVVQALAHIQPVRDTLLLIPDLKNQTTLVRRMALLVRRMWHPRLLKAHVSPHEFVQEAVNRSNHRFRLNAQCDAFEFLTWLLNTLHIDLGGTRKRASSVIYKSFQGEINVVSQKLEDTKIRGREDDPIVLDKHKPFSERKSPFLTLSLDLPPKPLFNDGEEDNNEDTDNPKKKASIPQVALVSLIQRYNGSTVVEHQGEARQYCLLKLPQYIICHVKRFSRNDFSIEKNPTVVNFSIRNVPFGELLPKNAQEQLPSASSATYDLIANICHDGQAPTDLRKTDETRSASSMVPAQPVAYSESEMAAFQSQYVTYLCHQADGKWFKLHDLNVEPIMPQMILLSDTYIQIWKRNS